MQQIVSYCAIKFYFIKYVKGEITKLKVSGFKTRKTISG